MADPFAPPPPVERPRTKPVLCGAQLGTARCNLYRDHISKMHRVLGTTVAWPVVEEES